MLNTKRTTVQKYQSPFYLSDFILLKTRNYFIFMSCIQPPPLAGNRSHLEKTLLTKVKSKTVLKGGYTFVIRQQLSYRLIQGSPVEILKNSTIKSRLTDSTCIFKLHKSISLLLTNQKIFLRAVSLAILPLFSFSLNYFLKDCFCSLSHLTVLCCRSQVQVKQNYEPSSHEI